jgi:hypothetical protein
MRRVRDADVSTAVNAGDEQGQVLHDGLQEPAYPHTGKRTVSGVDEGENNPAWKGGSYIEPEKGYRMIRMPDHPRARQNGYVLEHVVIAEKMLRTSAEVGRGSASQGPRPANNDPANLKSTTPISNTGCGASDRRSRCERCGGLTEARGLGTALKPAHEPICIAWKPFKGTIAGNYITHGTGGLDIEGCRIGADRIVGTRGAGGQHGKFSPIGESEYDHFSRWPSNVLLESPEAYAEIAPYLYVAKPSRKERDYGCESLPQKTAAELTGRKPGSAGLQNPRAGIRAGSMDRDINARVARNIHPTVKPVELMRWLVRLVTPPGGTVLDPFTGSGTTGMACRYELRPFVGIEREADYIAIAERRIAAVAPLFGEATA